ncbi:MAG: hypothetical protein KDA51_07400, partial [Planctomycetales bacterium]|nr:hypothetical protein [Planctomycetales bacterium]
MQGILSLIDHYEPQMGMRGSRSWATICLMGFFAAVSVGCGGDDYGSGNSANAVATKANASSSPQTFEAILLGNNNANSHPNLASML